MSTDAFSHDWFDAQNHCLGHGLTIERNKSNHPYWTGAYLKLTPWINILGQYLISFVFGKHSFLISSLSSMQLIKKNFGFNQFYKF